MFDFRSASIGQKLTAFIGIAIALVFVFIVAFYGHEQEKNILRQNERTVHKITESVIQGLQTVMIAGYADVAEVFAERLKGIGDVVDFRILRNDGLEAFRDNKTIREVNERRGDEDFLPRPKEEQIRVLPADDEHLQQTLKNGKYIYYYGSRQGEDTLTFLWPILHEKKCQKCHGADSDVRGVLELTTSLKGVQQEVRRTWLQAGGILVALLSVVIVVMTYLLRRTIVAPIEQVSAAMQKVSRGELSQQVPVLGRDELGEMAKNFNTMTDHLRQTYQGYRNEHNKLETVIFGSRDGIVVTNDRDEIVLVNPSAELLLGKSAQRLTEQGFVNLLGDPDHCRALLERAQPSTEIVLFNERILAVHIASIRMDADRLLGRTALIRDITEEKRLEQKLRSLSNTDGLTGLANRRCLDDTLEREFNRARAQHTHLSILMFDVDHFKRFNDTYGHDQGDRVLQAVAAETVRSVRTVDVACRYGGEEFLVILPETPQDGAIIVAERVRTAVEAMRVDMLHVTISIGVAGVHESGAETPGRLVELADAALYEAKHAGRNRVMGAAPRKETAHV